MNTNFYTKIYITFYSFCFSLCGMTKLEKLDLRNNQKLIGLPAHLHRLERLTELHLKRCSSLTFPPPAVHEQGLRAIQKSLTDFERGVGVKYLPVKTIGETLGWKMRLVKPTQKCKPKLLKRSAPITQNKPLRYSWCLRLPQMLRQKWCFITSDAIAESIVIIEKVWKLQIHQFSSETMIRKISRITFRTWFRPMTNKLDIVCYG